MDHPISKARTSGRHTRASSAGAPTLKNLAFECGLAEGINRQLLSPFRYFGVPDPVDFAPLPWLNSRFDSEALETAVITEDRAQAALREWQRLAGARTLAFCVSVRHADFMAQEFRQAGIAAVAVHSGPTSAPRHEALFDLARGRCRWSSAWTCSTRVWTCRRSTRCCC